MSGINPAEVWSVTGYSAFMNRGVETEDGFREALSIGELVTAMLAKLTGASDAGARHEKLAVDADEAGHHATLSGEFGQ